MSYSRLCRCNGSMFILNLINSPELTHRVSQLASIHDAITLGTFLEFGRLTRFCAKLLRILGGQAIGAYSTYREESSVSNRRQI